MYTKDVRANVLYNERKQRTKKTKKSRQKMSSFFALVFRKVGQEAYFLFYVFIQNFKLTKMKVPNYFSLKLEFLGFRKWLPETSSTRKNIV
jgi:hypothetical protein